MNSSLVIGDLHGDLGVLEQILVSSGVVSFAGGPWALPATHPVSLIQMGDMVDGKPRGSTSESRDASIAVVERMMELQTQAQEAGSEVVVIMGNHEFMNLKGDYRYVSNVEMHKEGGPRHWSRYFGNSHRVGRFLRSDRVRAVFQKNEYVFAHAGILPKLLKSYLPQNQTSGQIFRDGIDLLNQRLKNEVNQCADQGACRTLGLGSDGSFWTRELFERTCAKPRETLGLLPNAAHLVVGHTVQRDGITYRCEGDALIAVDCGLSRALSPRHSSVEFLEIVWHPEGKQEHLQVEVTGQAHTAAHTVVSVTFLGVGTLSPCLSLFLCRFCCEKKVALF